jgi:hypothetical protein
MEKMATPITQEQWQALEPGDRLKDKHDRLWEVIQRDPGNNNRLLAKCPGHITDRLDWHDGQILDEEWAIIVELNHPSVTIVR